MIFVPSPIEGLAGANGVRVKSRAKTLRRHLLSAATFIIVPACLMGTPARATTFAEAFGDMHSGDPAVTVQPGEEQGELAALQEQAPNSANVQKFETKPMPAAVAGPTLMGPPAIATSSAEPQFDWGPPPPGTPMALAEAIYIVTRKDPAARAAWFGARAALQQVKGAEWLRYPSLTADLGISDTVNRFAPTVGVEVPLWTGGRIGSTIDRAKSLEGVAVARWRETVLDLAVQVSDAYYNVVLYSRLADIYASSLEEHKRLVETMERRVAQEVSPLADLELARSRSAQIEQELTTVRAQRQSSMQSLAQLIREPTYRFGQLPEFDSTRANPSWSNVEEEAVEFSPTRERLKFEADASQAEIRVARSSLFPQLNAVYSYNDLVGSRLGLGLRLQTANGLSQFSAVSAATARYEQSLNQIQLAVRQLRQSVSTDVIVQQAAVGRAAVSASASDTAARVSASYMRQFIAGRRSWLDVMNSLREHLSAQASLIQAQMTAMLLETRLNLRSGRWGLVNAASDN